MEYKRGRKKTDDWDEIQLCAQALCLEEMLEVDICDGGLYYGKTHHRQQVLFNGPLRQRVTDLAATMQRLWQQRQTPPAEPGEKCNHCSLIDLCLPYGTTQRGVGDYLQRLFDEE